MPDLVVAKVRWEGIGFAVGKDQGADGVAETACNEQGHRAGTQLSVDGTDQENNDPAHQEEGRVRHPDGDLCEEDGFERDEENCQTPDDPK